MNQINGATVPFSIDDAQRAADTWGANCGPGALAAVLGLTLEQVRPHLGGYGSPIGDFERKHYTNPSLMVAALASLGVLWTKTEAKWPGRGLVRVQWEGPWTAPGVPLSRRQRHTHWVASRRLDDGVFIFDINCMSAGGWVPVAEWTKQVVPWLLEQCEPKATGKWHPTHRLELIGGLPTVESR